MAGRGRKPSGRAVRRNVVPARLTVRSDGKLGGFELPAGVLGTDAAGEPIVWHPVTVKWWDGWRASPQGVRMVTDVDWDFLLDTARMHQELWSKGRWELAAEVRLRVAKFGATPEDRARLRFDVETVEHYPIGESQASPIDIRSKERRDRWSNEIPRINTDITTRETPSTDALEL